MIQSVTAAPWPSVTVTDQALQGLGEDSAEEKDGDPASPAQNLLCFRRHGMTVLMRGTASLCFALVHISRSRSELLHSMHGHKDERSCAEGEGDANIARRDGVARVGAHDER